MPEAKRKRTRAKPEVRREQILNEAVRLIGERGYKGLTIQELADRCGLSQPGLLHYFDSKEALLIGILQHGDEPSAQFATAAAGMARGPDGAPPNMRQLRDLFHAIVLHNSKQPEIVRLFTTLRAEALNEDHPAHGYMKARIGASLESFELMLRPISKDPRAAALVLISTMHGLEHEWLRADLGFDLVAAWDYAADRLLPLS